MLFYHGHGQRDYADEPTPLRRRLHWECAAILSGTAAPHFATGLASIDTAALWIFPPQHLHGWGAHSHDGCTICTLHLAHMPRIIADRAEQEGFLCIALTSAARRTLQHLSQRLLQLLADGSDRAEIAADMARAEISCLVLPHLPRQRPASDSQAHTLKRILAWLEAHLHTGVGVDDAAQALHISPAHLRRIAHAVAGRSPRDLLRELRLERARDLLRQTDQSLSSIAWSCGYADDVALSNAFLRHLGQRPGSWRKAATQGRAMQSSEGRGKSCFAGRLFA